MINNTYKYQRCDLVNKCSAKEDDCIDGSKCNHVSGGVHKGQHTCKCPAGKEGDGKPASLGGSGTTKNWGGCRDINGCAKNPCDKLTTCSGGLGGKNKSPATAVWASLRG